MSTPQLAPLAVGRLSRREVAICYRVDTDLGHFYSVDYQVGDKKVTVRGQIGESFADVCARLPEHREKLDALHAEGF